MSRPGQPTAAEMSRRLDELERELDETDAQLSEAEEAWAHIDANAELEFSLAFIGADKQSMDMRKQIAIRDSYQARLDARVAKNEVNRLTRRFRKIERKINVQQSRGSYLRGELGLASSPYRP